MSKTAEKALNFFGGMATNVSASAFFASMPALGSLCLGVAAILTATDAAIQENAGQKDQGKITSALQRLIKVTGSVEKSLELLSAEADLHEIVSRERTAKLLQAIRKQASDSKSLLSENLELTGQVGIWLQRWCEQQGETLENLSRRLDYAANEYDVRLDRLESKVDRGNAASAERDAEMRGMLETITAHLSEDYEAEIDAAKQRLIDARLDEALLLLERLRERAWGKLSDRQKWRVLANLGHVYDAKDDYIRAAGFYQEAKEYHRNDAAAESLACLALVYRGDPTAAQKVEELRGKHPQNALAQALWVRFRDEDSEFKKTVEAIPEELRSDGEVAVALSRMAFRQQNFEGAEKYARLALENAQTPRVKLHLGSLLVDIERQRVKWVEGARPIIHDEAKLREAISLLTEVSDTFGRSTGAQTITTIRRARGLAYTLLDQHEKAEQDFQVAYDRSPDDPASSLDYALVQAERGPGGMERAIQALTKVATPGKVGQQDLQLASLLAKRNRGGDRERAVEILRSAVTSGNDWREPLRIQTLGLLTDILVASKDYGGARAMLQQTPAGFASKTVLLATESGLARAAGDPARAATLARDAAAGLTEGSTDSERRLVAKALSEAELHQEALPLWKLIVQPKYVGRDTLRLLEAARGCDDDAAVLDFCRALRENGHYDSFCLETEVATLAEYNGYTEAIEILQGYIARNPDDSEMRLARLRLSVLGIEADHPAIIETDPTKLPDVYSVNARTGEAVAHVLSHGPDPFEAVKYAYTLVRRHFDKKAAHRALIRSFMFGTTKKPRVPTSDEVKEGFAAVYKFDHEATTGGLIIEDVTPPPPSFERQEISTTDPRALDLDGKRVGESFHLRRSAIQDITATVQEIVHKSVYRVRDSLAHFEERFKDDFVLSINIPKRDDGSMDFSPIFRSVDERQKAIAEVEELFRVNHLPVASFAAMLGTPVLQTMEHVASQWNLSVRTSLGSEEEQREVSALFDTSRPIVLSPSAIATLKITGAYRLLKNPPFKLAVSHGTLNEYRRLFAEAMAQSDEGGIMTKIEDRHVFVPYEKAQIEHRRAELKHLLDWLVESCEVLDGTPLAYWPIRERSILTRSVGRECAESAALAGTGDRWLWDDDLGVGQFTKEFGVRRVWTQALFSHLADTGHVAVDEYHKLTIDLLRLRHRFTRINAQTILFSLATSDWAVGDPSVRIVLEALSDPIASDESVLGVVVETFRRIWSDGPNLDRKRAATQAVLTALGRRPGGRLMVRIIYRNTRIISADTPNFVLHLRWHLKNWLLTGSISDPTWTIMTHREWLTDEI